ncbi:MAG: DUF4043 family protein [Acidobacteria bacterium]|nr:DUF4043 family protein [Acidobacteriota bacterium]
MAETDPAAISALRKKLWSVQAWQYQLDENFFSASGMMGTSNGDNGKPVHFVDEFTKTDSGDKCVITLILDLTGDGESGDDQTEGRDEAILFDYFEITLDQFKKSVKNRGRMSERRTVMKFRSYAKEAIGRWKGQTIEELMMLTGAGISFDYRYDGRARPNGGIKRLAFGADITAPSSKRKVFPGAVTATSGLAVGDKMSWDVLVTARTKAERARMPGVRYKGGTKWSVVMSLEQGRDLRQDSDYQAAIQNAGLRGPTNPAFTGMFADVDGLMLFQHPKVPNTLGTTVKYGSGGLVDGAQALMFGTKALAFAKVGEDIWYEGEENRGEQIVYKNSTMLGMLKPVAKSQWEDETDQDFAMMSIYSAAAPS